MAKNETNGHSNGLRKPQARILAALKKAKRPLKGSEIALKAPVDKSSLTSLIGSHKDDVRTTNDERYFPCLLTLGLVKALKMEDGYEYEITTKGLKTVS